MKINIFIGYFYLLTSWTQIHTATDEKFVSSKNLEKNICIKMNIIDWQKTKAFNDNPSIVFFASWCSSCEEKIKKFSKEKNKEIYFIAVFDELKQSEIVAKQYGISNCIVDADDSIAKYYEIKSLPAKSINL